MPRDDWAKYARRDRVRKALASGEYDRVKPARKNKRKTKKKRARKQKASHSNAVEDGDFVIEYNGETPEESTIRYITGPVHLGLPDWPGFT